MDVDRHARAPITILIAAAVRLYREGLATTLKELAHLRIEATAAPSLDARSAARDLQPGIIILDVALENILDLMRALRSESSNSRILAFAVREDISAIL